ncbi:MAG: DUF2225 domain-containing protein [Candidatus Heimdallarchaeota archaeon]|nr:DUF2225 domain-containing protein [Candidatus Heimdallarchaeota archaeon]
MIIFTIYLGEWLLSSLKRNEIEKLLASRKKLLKRYQENLGNPIRRWLLKRSLSKSIELLWDKADFYYESGELEKALKLFNFIVKTIPKFNNEVEIGPLLNNIGMIYDAWTEYQKAEDYYQQALAIANKYGDKTGEETLYHNLGTLHKKQGNYQQALDFFLKVLEMKGENKLTKEHIDLFNSLGFIYHCLGNYQLAFDYYLQELELINKMGEKIDRAIALHNIAGVYEQWGKYQEALEYYEQALVIAKKINDRLTVESILNNLGGIFEVWGKYEQAVNYYQDALAITQELEDELEQATVLSNIGIVYESWGKYQQAEDYFKRALQINENYGNKDGQATALNNLGGIYEKREKYAQALEYYQQALKLQKEIGDKKGGAVSRNNIAGIFFCLGKEEKAEEYYSQALEIIQQIKNKAGEASLLNNLGMLYDSQENHEKALANYSQALKIHQELRNKDGEATTYHNIGFSYQALKQFNRAFVAYKKAIDIYEVLVGETKSSEIRRTIRKTKLSTFNTTIALLLEWYRAEKIDKRKKDKRLLLQALKFLELTKAREITDKLIQGKEILDLSDLCPEFKHLIEEEQQLTQKLNDFYRINHRECATLSHRGIDFSEASNRSFSSAELSELSRRLKLLRKKILENCTEPGLIHQTTKYEPIANFKKIFDYQPKTIIWEFFYEEELNPNNLQIIVWTKEDIEVYSADFNSNEIFTLLDQFHNEITNKDIFKANETLKQLAVFLGHSIPYNFWPMIEQKDLLILIPHEKLHLLPWHLAEKPSSSKPNQKSFPSNKIPSLGLNIPIVRSFSLGLVSSCLNRERPMRRNSLFVVNPNFNIGHYSLPGTEKEVDAVIDLFSDKTDFEMGYDLLKHEEASKELFKTKLSQEHAIIHFAGHGKYNSDDPWMSHLKFYNEEEVSAYTVTEMVLNRLKGSPLFILSACETARGKIDQGDEAIGLLRGLTLAGTTTIIATNWKLSDEVAPHFMKKFYHYLLQEKTVANALFLARKELYKEGFTNPIDWGVYELYGNPFKKLNQK